MCLLGDDVPLVDQSSVEAFGGLRVDPLVHDDNVGNVDGSDGEVEFERNDVLQDAGPIVFAENGLSDENAVTSFLVSFLGGINYYNSFHQTIE